IIFLFSLFVLSCTQSRLTPLQKWELANLHTKEEPSRGVAQLLNERCESTLDDEKSVALLVAQEELKRAKELFGKVTSTTAKKRLFEYFQANFSKYILSHPEHKECSSVDCLYASYYPKGGLEGIWSYIWWLRTGSILAISDTIP